VLEYQAGRPVGPQLRWGADGALERVELRLDGEDAG
jgi:hypothetical protein